MTQLTRRDFLGQLGLGLSMTIATGIASGEGGKLPQMIRRPIPASQGKETLPVIGMGTWNTFDVASGTQAAAPLLEVLQAFYDAGARVIDSSPMYGRAEGITGNLVAQLGKQDETFFATKVWTSGADQGVEQIEESFRRLRTPRLDLLQIHNLLDWKTHAATLRRLKDADRVRYTGVTHYTVGSYGDLESVLRAEPFDFVQFNYSIATREAEQRLLPFCQEHGIAVLINRPFEEGELFTRVSNRKLPGYAREIDCRSWSQFFLKYIVSHPAVTCVIPATSRLSHMQDNLRAGFGRLPDAKLRLRMAKEFS